MLLFSSTRLSNNEKWRIGRRRDFLSPIAINRKTLDTNDLNQVVASSGFSENKGWVKECSVWRAHKPCSRWFLLKDFPVNRAPTSLVMAFETKMAASYSKRSILRKNRRR